MFQRGDKTQRGKELIFTHLLPAVILGNMLLKVTQLQHKLAQLRVIYPQFFRHRAPTAQVKTRLLKLFHEPPGLFSLGGMNTQQQQDFY